MAITNNLTEFADNETAQYFTPTQLAESTNITHVGAVLNNRLNYKSYNSLAKMTSKVVVALGDFIVNYSGIASGTIDINTTVAQWGVFLASIMTDWKLANSVNATTPLTISGTTANSKTTEGHTHQIDFVSLTSGFEAGFNATTNGFGGAIGREASAQNGGAVGYKSKETLGGGAVGNTSSATTGGAVGFGATETGGGGAVGHSAEAKSGFAGGFNASAGALNSVQLGEGSNDDDNTIQYLSNKVFNADLTKLAPTTANGWTKIDSLTGTPLNLTGKYMFFLTTANGITIGTYYDTIMNLGTTNTLSFGYNGGFARIYVSTTGAITGDVRPDSGSTATLTRISLWYKKMW